MATWCEELTHWKRPQCWERLKAGGEGTTEDETVGWHHWLNGYKFEQALGVGDRQGSLACCSRGVTKSWTWLSNWTELNWNPNNIKHYLITLKLCKSISEILTLKAISPNASIILRDYPAVSPGYLSTETSWEVLRLPEVGDRCRANIKVLHSLLLQLTANGWLWATPAEPGLSWILDPSQTMRCFWVYRAGGQIQRWIYQSWWKWTRSVVSDSVRPHRQQPTRLPRPWDSPGKNTGVG